MENHSTAQWENSMKVLIIGGFLGSGKTTALMRLAQYVVNKNAGDRTSAQFPVVILENEVSNTGIDNRLLSRSGLKVREMLSGCICCSSSAQLAEQVQAIKEEYAPQWLFIEATGLAYPDSVWKILQTELQIDARILTLIDAGRWMRLVKAMPQFAAAQTKKADLVIINKIDLVTGQQLLQIRESLQKLHVTAQICEKSIRNNLDTAFWEEQMKIWEAGYV